MSAWATTIISGLVLIVAFMQWRTSHQKVVMDLFDRRIKVIHAVKAFQSLLFQKAMRQDADDIVAFHLVRQEAEFLFGTDVTAYLKKLHETVIDMNTAMASMDAEDPESQTRYRNSASAKYKDALTMSTEFTALCAPYMRMDQKRVRTPAEWFHDRNALRKSFGDQHQG